MAYSTISIFRHSLPAETAVVARPVGSRKLYCMRLQCTAHSAADRTMCRRRFPPAIHLRHRMNRVEGAAWVVRIGHFAAPGGRDSRERGSG
jgi:hypothetical protein